MKEIQAGVKQIEQQMSKLKADVRRLVFPLLLVLSLGLIVPEWLVASVRGWIDHLSTPRPHHPTLQNNRVQKQLKLLKDEKTELDEEIAEAQASVSAAASATQAGQLDDLQGEIEDAEEEIKAAQAAIAQLKEQKKAVRASRMLVLCCVQVGCVG